MSAGNDPRGHLPGDRGSKFHTGGVIASGTPAPEIIRNGDCFVVERGGFTRLVQSSIDRRARVDKWDRRFLDLAAQVASWSKDPKTGVGAVLVDDNRRVVSLGYNGFPDKFPDDPAKLATDEKHEAMIHAELNAILNCPVPTKGLTLYCTHSPCGPCQPMIVQAGIRRLVTPVMDEKWLAKHPIRDVLKCIETRFVPHEKENYDGEATYG